MILIEKGRGRYVRTSEFRVDPVVKIGSRRCPGRVGVKELVRRAEGGVPLFDEKGIRPKNSSLRGVFLDKE
jgi:hypothetical protein